LFFFASLVHYVQLPKNYKALAIDPHPSKGKCSTFSISYDSSETSSYRINSLPSNLEVDVRRITFDDTHFRISRVEENKSTDAYLQKDT